MSAATLTPTRTVPTGAARLGGRFVGTWDLVRLAIRRDRVLVPVWWAVFVISAAGSASATVGLYPTEGQRVAAAEQVNVNPALLAMFGPISDPTSIGQLLALQDDSDGCRHGGSALAGPHGAAHAW